MKKKQSQMLEKFTEVSIKVGNQIYLRTLRDAFSTIMPMFVLAGIAVLLNNVIFPWIASGKNLENLQIFGNLLTNGTLGISGLLIAPMIAYYLAQNRRYTNTISAVSVSLSVLMIMMAINVYATNLDTGKEILVSGVVALKHLGTQGMFAGIIVGLFATELFIKLAKMKKLQINLGDNVPPAVGRSFSSLIPTLITLSIFAVISAILIIFFNTDFITLISELIQEPLRKINTSLLGFLVIFTTGNFLFTLGIHQAVINGSILDPVLLVNMNENMEAINQGKDAPHILNNSFVIVFTQIGGSGVTLALLIAIFLFIKYKPYRDMAGLSLAPGIFEINEPLVFGLPIVFNLPMMIPFIVSPIIGTLIGYFATVIGFIKPLGLLVPWSTPPLINAYLASMGDWKVVAVQVIIIIITTLFYLPFLRISVKVAQKAAEQNL